MAYSDSLPLHGVSFAYINHFVAAIVIIKHNKNWKKAFLKPLQIGCFGQLSVFKLPS